MKKVIMSLIVLVPFFGIAQNNTGVAFTNGLNWQQIRQKAEKENKLIFIDAYATWCGPCKMMDKEIYSEKEIGDSLNSRFIAVRLQMDTTKDDLPVIRQWYKDAAAIQKKYMISAFPTFLFLYPSGDLLERDLGYKNKADFLALIQRAANPELNYAGLIKRFNKGKLVKSELVKLAIEAKRNQDDSIALAIASSFKRQFIDNVPPEQVFSPLIIDVLTSFGPLFTFNDSIIKYMYFHPEAADDSLKLWKGYSTAYTDYIINRDWINSEILPQGNSSAKEPSWKDLEHRIAMVFDQSTAKRLVLNAKIGWYYGKQDWDNAIKYEIEKVDINGLDTSGMGTLGINNLVYEVIFKHSNDSYALKKGINFMESILKIDPDNHSKIDTYSNILYKAGYKQKAIVQEEKALVIAKKEKDDRSIQLYEQTIEKMRQNKPTWN